MVYVPLKNGGGQVVKDIKLKSPEGKVFTVTGTSRKGINRYAITMKDDDGNTRMVMNHQIRVKKDPNHEPWSVVGGFHSPEKLAKMFNRPLDPDANKPRPERASFWKMNSRPGSHNYKQKERLMKQDPEKYKTFKEFREDQSDLVEGPKDAAGKDVFVKKIAKSAGVSYDKAGAIAAAAGRKRLGKAEFTRRQVAGQKAAAAARKRGEKYSG
jgi:hypothetical protein